MDARAIITSAYRWLNRLSPGETLSADDAAFALERLNDLVDEWSAEALFLSQDLAVTATQTGHITLGAGAWASIVPGADIVSASADEYGLAYMPMAQYIRLSDPTTSGTPDTYTPDGLSTVYLYPVPAAVSVILQVRIGVAAFADLDTVYTAPGGFKAALGISLAIRVAPTLLGGVPAPLVRAEARALAGIRTPRPAIVHADGYYPRYSSDILSGDTL